MSNRKPNPFKGVPRAEWGRVRAEMAAAKAHAAMQEPNSVAAVLNAPQDTFTATSSFDLPPEVAKTISTDPDPAPEYASGIPRDLFSGSLRQLDVMGKNGSFTDPLPGYELYWFTDIGGTGVRINQAKMSGWEMVHNSEVLLTQDIAGNNDLGSHVRKVVNARTVPPEYGYLMKKPKALHQLHLQEREKLHQRIDAALRSGTLGRKAGDGQYTKAEDPTSSLSRIDIKSNLVTENRNG